MLSALNCLALIVAIVILTNKDAYQANAATTLMPAVCSAQEEASLPCVCCKKSCWFGIAEMTTAYFGHMPGERSDAESKFTLAMMRQCFVTECANACTSH
uniref:Uncharacterized protein n=1 Tax=Caenorhabditis japonica TaxID=281687 RepID=A0A8R1DWX8_CAEJA